MDSINPQQFWTSISILLNNYHTINRKLCMCLIERVEATRRAPTSLEKLPKNQVEVVDKSILRHLQNLTDNTEYEKLTVHYKCLKKKCDDSIAATGVLDFRNTSFRLTFMCETLDDFEVQLQNNILHVEMLNGLAGTTTNERWSEFVLKPKLMKWAQVTTDLEPMISGQSTSLRLVDGERYNKLYNDFKQKYSEKALKLWDEVNESTDPLKFIYEDLAIAAYLITLWQSDVNAHSPQKFADLGCGNGLLVYILIEEGFPGFGYDVRARKLWSYYPSKVSQSLFEQTIEPLNFSLPPEVDWVIGNHSDELSPWLPVLAATSHYHMKYFLLPCCAYEFSGNKFQRRNSSVSAYKDFCDYAESISVRCGFVTEKDRLKIPSTKRIAFIGRRRNYAADEHSHKVDEMKVFVKEEQQMHCSAEQQGIKLREKVEIMRNCTQIDKQIINRIVMKIFKLLLNGNSSNQVHNVSEEIWREGRPLTMSEIAKELNKDDLKDIKSECGGLKTLLRNKHEIFELFKPDFVKIRKPSWQQRPNTAKPQTIKKRPCYFHENHPQGCPLSNDECTFLH